MDETLATSGQAIDGGLWESFERANALAGRFVVLHELGRGASGRVLRARDQCSGQIVALKLPLEQASALQAMGIREEARLLARLEHPGILRMVSSGDLQPLLPYLALEWLTGEDLAERQVRLPLSPVEAVSVMADVASALEAVHRAGVVHRDVKPSNIFLVEDASVPLGFSTRLIDFGAALRLSSLAERGSVRPVVGMPSEAPISQVGGPVGTLAYVAPEQARGDQFATFRSDLYSLGATLYELLSGRPPQLEVSWINLLARSFDALPPRLSASQKGISVELENLVGQLLQNDLALRPSSAQGVARGLRAVQGTMEGAPGEPESP